MAVLIASDLRKDINGEPLLSGVSFKLERRERMTLSARNGAGKTTLLRMIAGEAQIDGGDLVLAKGTRVALHDQRPPRDEGMTLREYILSGAPEITRLERRLRKLEQRMAGGDYEEPTLNAYADAQAAFEHAGGYTWREHALQMLRGLGLDGDDLLDRRLDTFSGGELTRASLGRALAGKPDLLLLDEPTNHLDIAALEWLEAYLVSIDAAVLLVAHDRWFLEAVGTSVLEVEDGHSHYFHGTWHQWRKEKASRELALGRAIERQQAEIARLEHFVTRFGVGTRARQAQSRQKQLDKIKRIDRRQKNDQSFEFAFKPPERSGRVVFELSGGRVALGERVMLHDAELWLERGEHVSVVGPNGAGKTTLIETLAGVRPFASDDSETRDAKGMAIQSSATVAAAAAAAAAADDAARTGTVDGQQPPVVSGTLRTGHNVQIGFLSQHTEVLDNGGARTVLEAAQHATGLKPGPARALLGKFLFSGDDAEKPLDGLSGGERRRLALAIVVQSGANVLVLDEPTNHLDIEGREALEAALSEFPGSLLLISHDRALLDAVGTRTIAFEDGTLHSYVGGWAEYVRVRAEREAEETAAKARQQAAAAKKQAATASKQEKTPVAGKQAKAVAKAQRQPGKASQDKLERQIEKAEAALHAVEDELADPGAWATPERSAKSTAKHAAAKSAVDKLYARYEQLVG